MKEEKRTPLILAALILTLTLAWSGVAFGGVGDTPPPTLTDASPAAKAMLVQAETPAQTKATPSAKPSETKTTAPDAKKVPVTDVVVKAEKEKKPKEGSAEVGYKVENTTTTGPWGEMKIQDAPYSISVMPSEMIENVITGNPDQLFRMNPLTQLYMPQALNGRPTFNMRGFYVASSAEEGIRNYNGWGIFLEDIDRVEVITGLSGFLYGPGNVGGMVNYVTKRPTKERLNSITAGNYGGGQYYVHGDFGGPIDKQGKLGYRINLMTQDGDTAVDFQNIRRNLFSGAFDWHITDNILLQLNASHQDYTANGLPASWGTASGVGHRSAPDAEKLWSQKWTFQNIETNKGGINLKWDVNNIFSLRTAYHVAEYNDESRSVVATIQKNGTYSEIIFARAPRKLETTGGYAFLDAHFNTAFIEHKLTAGFYGDTAKWRLHQDSRYADYLPGSFPLSDPAYVNVPPYTIGAKGWHTDYYGTNENYTIGDQIKFNDSWSALVGVNSVTIRAKNYDSNGVLNSNYTGL